MGGRKDLGDKGLESYEQQDERNRKLENYKYEKLSVYCCTTTRKITKEKKVLK